MIWRLRDQRRRTSAALLVAIVGLHGANAKAQPTSACDAHGQITAATRADSIRFLLPSSDSTQPPSVIDVAGAPALRQTIALHLRNATREEALSEIARVSGLSVVYASDLVARRGTIGLDGTSIPVGEALHDVLDGLALDVIVNDVGSIVLTKRNALAASSGPVASVVDGVVLDSDLRMPVGLAAVRIVGTTKTVLTDDAGHFRIGGVAGPIELDVRRIGFRPAVQRVVAGRGLTNDSVALIPVPRGLDTVVVTTDRNHDATHVTDEAARRIVTAAIARRIANRAGVADYRYDAHVIQFERAPRAPIDSASSITAVRESVIQGYWQAPSRAQQIVVARRETDRASIGIRTQLGPVNIQRVEAFGDDRWSVFGVPPTPIVSPIGSDALRHYAFAILDTLMVNHQRVIRLSVNPLSTANPSFDGIIDVADSTFDVLGVDVGMKNVSVDMFSISNLQIHLRYADVGDRRTMPVSINAVLRTSIFGFDADVDYRAVLDRFQFNSHAAPPGLGEYGVVVTPNADVASQTVYARAPMISLNGAAAVVQAEIDSAGGAPPGWNRPGGFHLNANNLVDIRFNRVDGWRYGAGGSTDVPWDRYWTTPTVKAGYEFGAKRWTYDVGDRVLLSPEDRLSFGFRLYDETHTPAIFASDNYNPTFAALFAGSGADALDYYRERGASASISTRLLDLTQLTVSFGRSRQSSLSTLPRYASASGGLFGLTTPPNFSIVDGLLNAATVHAEYDSRPLVLEPRSYKPLQTAGFAYSEGSFTRISIDTRIAVSASIGGDFNYRRYMLRAERREEDWRFGSTDLVAVAGLSTGSLPPQEFFEVNGGAPVSSVNSPFSTLGDSVFGGRRAAAITAVHEFGRSFFRASGIPLVREIPFDLSMHASTFWSLAPNVSEGAGGRGIHEAPTAYDEVGLAIGYGIARLPLELALRVSRQISRYPTSGTRVAIGFY